MSITTIVFDFGNVVGFFSHRKAAAQLAAFGTASVEELYTFLFGGELEDEYESGSISSDALIKYVCNKFQLNCTPDQFALAFSDMFTPNEEVCALLPRLKPRYRLLLLSNTTELHAHHFLVQFAEQMKWFDHLVLSYEIGVRKPKPGIYQRCLKLAGSRPDQCVFIDDVPANVEGAKACGWQGLVYRRGEDLAAQLAQLGVELLPQSGK
jgi:FMN phosphatase YigB (HAD superfamily)